MVIYLESITKDIIILMNNIVDSNDYTVCKANFLKLAIIYMKNREIFNNYIDSNMELTLKVLDKLNQLSVIDEL